MPIITSFAYERLYSHIDTRMKSLGASTEVIKKKKKKKRKNGRKKELNKNKRIKLKKKKKEGKKNEIGKGSKNGATT